MSFGAKIKKAMKERGITAKTLAENIGVTRGLVTHWTNDVRNPNPEQVKAILHHLGISSSELFGESEVKLVPIIGTASCGGVDIDYLQDRGESAFYSGDFYSTNLYCVIANGDSMSPEIEDGDEVICDPKANIQSGDMVHYRIGVESAIKVFWEDNDANIIQLIPYNQTESFKTRTIRKDDDLFNEIVIAKVIAINKLKLDNRLSRLSMVGRG